MTMYRDEPLRRLCVLFASRPRALSSVHTRVLIAIVNRKPEDEAKLWQYILLRNPVYAPRIGRKRI